MFLFGCQNKIQVQATCPTLLNNFHSELVFAIVQKSFDELKNCVCYEEKKLKYCKLMCDSSGLISDECYWKVLKSSCKEPYYACMFSK